MPSKRLFDYNVFLSMLENGDYAAINAKIAYLTDFRLLNRMDICLGLKLSGNTAHHQHPHSKEINQLHKTIMLTKKAILNKKNCA
jgi:hypothetical protein